MSHIPDFSTLDFAPAGAAASAADAKPWLTPEGIPVKPVYGPDDLAGLGAAHRLEAVPAYLLRRLARRIGHVPASERILD